MRIAVADNAHEVCRVNSLTIGNNTAQQLLQNAHFVCREGGQDLLLLFGSNISQHAGLAFSCLGQVMAILVLDTKPLRYNASCASSISLVGIAISASRQALSRQASLSNTSSILASLARNPVESCLGW